MKLPYVLAGTAALLLPIMFTGCTAQQDTIIPPATQSPVSTASAPVSTPTVTPVATPTLTATPTVTQPHILISGAPRPTTTVKPTPKATKAPMAATVSIAKKRAILQLRNLKVQEADYAVKYNRTKDFGTAWKDVDHNGCDTRNDILRRDLTNIVYRSDDPTCTIASGTLNDPYTATKIAFVRGPKSSVIEIDHVAPLHYLALHGAESWSFEKREAYANDPAVLLAVQGTANEQKSDSGPADWMPSNTAYRCTYVEKFTNALYKYNATISRRDAAKVKGVLDTCK